MFTGIVEAVGQVVELSATAQGSRLRVATPLAADLKQGDSVAVNGVCLTALEGRGQEFIADIGPETARVTNLRTLAAGRGVNLERPLKLGGRLDGHLVLGHVDAVGRVEAIRADGESHWVTVSFPASLAPYFIPKGSVAVDGVSLTVAGLRGGEFDVQIVPHTWRHTTLSAVVIGDLVNLECDMIGKHVVRALELMQPAAEKH